MPFEIIRNDITKVTADAIVNAANTKLQHGGGVCGAIFTAAGVEALQHECDAIGGCAVGGAVITKGYNLPADFIIHVVGPVWHGGDENEDALLRGAYNNALGLAKEYGLNSIAFPLISAGTYGYPKDLALKAATETIKEFLTENDMKVTLVVYDRSAFEISEKLYSAVAKYIDDHYVAEHPSRRNTPQARERQQDFILSEPADYAEDINFYGEPDETKKTCKESSFSFIDTRHPHPVESAKTELSFEHLEETFSQMLLRLIDKKGKTDTEVYKKANIDRRLFSKIRSRKDYRPTKPTAVALCIALELNIDETADLLRRAGFALSPCERFDVIVEYFILNGNYNIFDINETLFKFEERLLGA